MNGNERGDRFIGIKVFCISTLELSKRIFAIPKTYKSKFDLTTRAASLAGTLKKYLTKTLERMYTD